MPTRKTRKKAGQQRLKKARGGSNRLVGAADPVRVAPPHKDSDGLLIRIVPGTTSFVVIQLGRR